jgi:hypothetical protein
MNIFNKKETNLLAVFCEMRTDMKNNHYLRGSEKIGEYLSEPKYTLVETINKDNMVGLKEGSSSVVFEVWKLSKSDSLRIEMLKGWHYKNYEFNKNIKKNIKTPYGDALVYMDNITKINSTTVIEDYDYSDYAFYQHN